jgi:hypothetical protein
MGKQRILALLVFSLLVLSGFVQERWKVAINFYLDQGDRIPGFYEMIPEERREALQTTKKSFNRPHDYYYSHETPALLCRADRKQAVWVKWGLAILLLLYSALFNALFIRLWFGAAQYVRWLLRMYGIALFLAFAGNGILRCTGLTDIAYLFSREILGALQSALPSMLLLPGIWLYRYSSSHSS